MKLQIWPIHLKAAGEFVKKYHRHNVPPVGGKFAVACYCDSSLCGVAICGRPVSRYLDDGKPLKFIVIVRMAPEMLAVNYMGPVFGLPVKWVITK